MKTDLSGAPFLLKEAELQEGFSMGTIKNLEKINLCKRGKVQKGMLFIDEMNKKEPVIDRVIIFGSAIREDCTEDSDIDVCIDTKYDTHNSTYFNASGRLSDVMDDLCDILKYNRLNQNFKRIVDQGVVVYER